jgi:hypothetical protein
MDKRKQENTAKKEREREVPAEKYIQKNVKITNVMTMEIK